MNYNSLSSRNGRSGGASNRNSPRQGAPGADHVGTRLGSSCGTRLLEQIYPYKLYPNYQAVVKSNFHRLNDFCEMAVLLIVEYHTK